MNPIPKILAAADNFQQKRRLPGFLYGVIKKYGEDQAGYQAALLTYYGFLSLFPLLLVLATVAGIVARNDPAMQQTIIGSINDYFPVLGDQLSGHVQTLHKSGLALVVGIVFTLYGARGVADAFQHGVNRIWYVPPTKEPGFPLKIFKSLGIIATVGIGLIGASAIAGFAAAAGTGIVIRVLSLLINLGILAGLFIILLKLIVPRPIPFKSAINGAAIAAIGLVVLQVAGGYLLTRELKNLDALYSNFAIPLGLLFWIYLQSQVIYYAVEVSAVRAYKLWPRSLTGDDLTEADKMSYSRRTASTEMVEAQDIDTSFKDS